MLGIASLLAGTASSELSEKLSSAKRQAVVYGLIGLLVLTSYATGVAALTVHLASTYGLVWALIWVSLISSGLAICCVVLRMIVHKIRRNRRNKNAASRALAVSAGLSLMPMLVKNRGMFAALTVAGVAALLSNGSRK